MELLWNGLVDAIELIFSLDSLVVSAAWTSLWVSLTAVILATCVGILIGLVLARKKIAGHKFWVIAFQAGMGVPTVLIGLLCFASFSRRGPFGAAELLYTPWAIVAGEFFLALPIVVSLTCGAISALDRRVFETAKTLGAKPFRRCLTYLSEARIGIVLAILTSFARCFTELGIAMMVGGNIKFRTRTLATATAMETSQGEFSRAIAMSLILLLMAMTITAVISWFSSRSQMNEP